jgi:predicted RNA-binding protein (virulence factor B family)
MQTAYVNRLTAYGAYLSETPNGEVEIPLEGKNALKLEVDMAVEVYVYLDKTEKMVATLQRPLLCLGDIGKLKVVGKIKAGYFLDNHSERDVFLPSDAAKRAVKLGDEVLVKLLMAERQTLNATMRIYDILDVSTTYKLGETVEGIVYDVKSEMGAFVAVDGLYHGFIPKHELYPEIVEGAKISARITKIREDGKLNLSIRQKASTQIHDDEAVILSALDENDGVLMLGDGSDPEVIKQKLKMSKRAFKRVIGKLYKEGKIELTNDRIRRL